MRRRERIVLIRSGRHLAVAIKALREISPDCDIAVVGTPGSESAILQAGIPPNRIFVYARRSRFSPLAFAFSATSLSIRLRGFDRVAVLWNDPDGRGQGNVDRTAFTLDPRGFLAITPDGTVTRRSWIPQARFEVRRTWRSLATAVMLGALYVPAMLIPGRRS